MAFPDRAPRPKRRFAWLLFWLLLLTAVGLLGWLWSRSGAFSLGLGGGMPVQPLPLAELERGFAQVDGGTYAAAAASFSTPLAQSLVTWHYQRQPNSTASAQARLDFHHQHPYWPAKNARFAPLFDAAAPPLDPISRITLLDTLGFTELGGEALSDDLRIERAIAFRDLSQHSRAADQTRQLWRQTSLSAGQQRRLLDELGFYLSAEDHSARLDWLTFPLRRAELERLEALVTGDGEAAFIRFLLGEESLPPLTHEQHPYLIQRDVRQLDREGRLDAALLRLADAPAGQDARLWPTRLLVMRSLYRAKRFAEAYALSQGLTLAPEQAVDAELMAGWLALTQLELPATAVTHYDAALALALGPKQRAKALRGQARALAALGLDAEAKLAACAELAMTFHGQLCLDDLGRRLRSRTERARGRPSQESQALARAALTLQALNLTQSADLFLRALRAEAQSLADLQLAQRLTNSGGSGLALTYIRLTEPGGTKSEALALLPRRRIPRDLELPLALIHAVIWQESRFQPRARSVAGARGLMQLMPATAERQAERLAIQDHHPDRLFEPGYNILLGSDHLADLLERYDGALLLALAAYNAGPGNVDNWLAAFGDPRLGVIAPEDWIESIPFRETRLYVQDLLAVYSLYREALGWRPVRPLLEERMTGSQTL